MASSRTPVQNLLWPILVALPLFFDVLLFYTDRPFHRRYFEDELGIIELPTFFVLVVLVGVAAWGATRTRGAVRRALAFLALGAFYWGGEEVDWGQTFFHWATPAGWSATNYQHEENIHNTKGLVGTLTNQTPRFVLEVLMVLAVLLAVPQLPRLRELVRERFGGRWLVPIPAAAPVAALALGAAILNKAIHKEYKGFGETHELYIAIFLLTYALGLIRAARATPEATA